VNRDRVPPVWVLALPWLTFGMLTGFIIVTLPQLLVSDGLSNARIAVVVAIVLSPMFWNFLFAPLLDIGFRRRTYAVIFGVLAVVLTATTIDHHGSISEVEGMMVGGFLSACMFQSAIGGWVGSLVDRTEDGRLGAWSTICNIFGSGAGILLSGYAVRRFSPTAAAAFIFATFLAPLVVIPSIPATAREQDQLRESFGRFAGEVGALLRRAEVRVALCLFALPAASFALSNTLGSWSTAFHATPAFVSEVSGIGLMLGGVCGCALVPRLARRMALRPLYLAIGCAGAVFTLTLLMLPHAPGTFALAFVGETFFSSAAIAAGAAIIFDVIGRGGALSATTYALLIAALNLPIDYMEFIDARGYRWHGIAGALLTDALVSGGVCVLLAIFLRRRLRPVLLPGQSERQTAADA